MIDVLNLALPYFGLIFLGLACGRLKQIPDTGLAWMNFFIVYVALPCLFYRIVAKTPLEELVNVSFVVATSISTTIAFFIAFAIAKFGRRTMPEATIAGLAGGYGNIGYMGPGLALSTLGPQAAAPVALIFCFDSIVLFSLVPFLMEIGGGERRGFWRSVAVRGPADRAASVHHRDGAGRDLGGAAFRAAGGARSADAIPAERRRALRAVRARRDGGSAAVAEARLGRSGDRAGEARAASADRILHAGAGSGRSARPGPMPRC